MIEKIQTIKALGSQLYALLEKAGYTVDSYQWDMDSGHLEKDFDDYAYSYVRTHKELYPTLENIPCLAGLFTYGEWKPVPYREK